MDTFRLFLTNLESQYLALFIYFGKIVIDRYWGYIFKGINVLAEERQLHLLSCYTSLSFALDVKLFNTILEEWKYDYLGKFLCDY